MNIDRSIEELLHGLRAMPGMKAPPGLAMRLRVMASRERKRREIHSTVADTFDHYLSLLRLHAENLMRPVAIPAVGGVTAALLIFSMVAANYPVQASTHNDVPTVLYTEAEFRNMGLVPIDTEEVVVELTIDDEGRVLKCDLAEGGVPVQNAKQLQHQLERALLYAQFVPATSFGQPVVGKVRIAFRRGNIEVRG